jgi:hypothetical protein
MSEAKSRVHLFERAQTATLEAEDEAFLWANAASAVLPRRGVPLGDQRQAARDPEEALLELTDLAPSRSRRAPRRPPPAEQEEALTA